MAGQKPFPLYTDGTGIFFTSDGVNFIQVGGGAAGSIPLSELAVQADQTAVGNVSGSSASPVALTKTQLTTLINPATASLPGAMPAAYASGLPVVCLQTAIIDLTATASGIAFLQNPPAGYYATPVIGNIVITSGAGTVSTSPTIKIGNNAGVNNIITTTTPSTANIQACITNTPPTLATLIVAVGTTSATLLDAATPITATVTGGTGTGGFALMGRLSILVALHTPVP